MANELTAGEKIARDLCEMDAPTDGIEVDPVDVARRIDSELEELRDQLAVVQAENERLRATPPDQRQDLHCVVSDIAAECRELRDQLTATRTALAAAEADNERLREAATAVLFNELDKVHMHPCDMHNRELQAKLAAPLLTNLYHVIFQPRDDSALRRLLDEAKAGVYEECAKVADLFEQEADALNDSIADDDDANEGRSEYIMGKATASSRIAKAIRALAEKAKGE